MFEIEWLGLEEPSRERCRVERHDGGVRIAGVIERQDGAYEYRLETDPGWRFASVVIKHRESSRTVSIRHGAERWTVDGRERPELAAAVEIDLSASPVSNTLPIRRLALPIGQAADLVTAYIAVPELTVVPDPQRYTRIGDREWLYESRDSDFRRIIDVDEHGFVVSYPGLFERA